MMLAWNELGGEEIRSTRLLCSQRTGQQYAAGCQPWLHAGTTWGVFYFWGGGRVFNFSLFPVNAWASHIS